MENKEPENDLFAEPCLNRFISTTTSLLSHRLSASECIEMCLLNLFSIHPDLHRGTRTDV